MKECPTCSQPVPESAKFCSMCRFDFAAFEAALDVEAAEGRAEGTRAVRDFVLFGATIVAIVLLALRALA